MMILNLHPDNFMTEQIGAMGKHFQSTAIKDRDAFFFLLEKNAKPMSKAAQLANFFFLPHVVSKLVCTCQGKIKSVI